MSSRALTLSIVVPTFRRPEYLRRCVAGILAQERVPDEVVIAYRASDHETARVVGEAASDGLKLVSVAEPGQVAAMAAGVGQSTGSVVAFTDDDAVPRPDWTARLLAHFAEPGVGGVGGRDVVHGDPDQRRLADVGIVTKWGKVIGHHHLGTGLARDVDVLKGANMAFRRDALAIPQGLRGAGAEVHNDLAVSLRAVEQGWRVVYDPAIVVDHFVSPRFDDHQRNAPSVIAARDAAYNLVISVLSARPQLVWRRASYGLLIGDAGAPGLARGAYALVRRDRRMAARVLPSVAGQTTALIEVLRGKRLGMRTFTPVTEARQTPSSAP